MPAHQSTDQLTERLIAVRDRIKPLTRQGEDNIWRPAKEAVDALADAANRIVEPEAALKPFAAKLVDIGEDETDADHFSNARSPYNKAVSVKVGDVRRAAAITRAEAL